MNITIQEFNAFIVHINGWLDGATEYNYVCGNYLAHDLTVSSENAETPYISIRVKLPDDLYEQPTYFSYPRDVHMNAMTIFLKHVIAYGLWDCIPFPSDLIDAIARDIQIDLRGNDESFEVTFSSRHVHVERQRAMFNLIKGDV